MGVTAVNDRYSRCSGDQRSPFLSALGLGLALVACDVPVEPREHTAEPATTIGGAIELGAFGPEPGGDAVLFRYDCASPPPPQGTGRPVDFLLVPEARFDGGRAAFAFSSVPAEVCSLILGFIDIDDDFHYALDITAQPSAGDLGLGSVERVTGGVEDEVDFIAPPPPVTLRPTSAYDHDRPTFRVAGQDPELEMHLGNTPGTTPPLRLDLVSTVLTTEVLRLEDPAFDVVFGSDDDGDGLPDDGNGDALPDVDWPKVYVQRLDPADPSGETLADPPVLLPGVVMAIDLEATASGYNLLAQAEALGIALDETGLLVTTEIRIYVPALVVTSLDPLELTPLESVAASGVPVAGAYSILVMNSDGRLWQLPNMLAGLGVSSQGVSVEVVVP